LPRTLLVTETSAVPAQRRLLICTVSAMNRLRVGASQSLKELVGKKV
jgi:hypothetical protein